MNDDKAKNVEPQVESSDLLPCCLDCDAHMIIPDPDPDDWFCDDDKAVVCTETVNDERNNASKYAADKSSHKPVQVGIRPYRLRKEAVTPKWCPRKAG